MAEEIIDLTGDSAGEDKSTVQVANTSQAAADTGLDQTLASDILHSADEGELATCIDDTSRAQLKLAVDNTPESRLRHVIKRLIDSNPAVEVALTEELVTVKKRSREVVIRWVICTNCDEEFDASTVRIDEECTYHEGAQIKLRIYTG